MRTGSRRHSIVGVVSGCGEAAPFGAEPYTNFRDTTFANAMDVDLAAHNPLRNKICHGQQTEYGTQEHSLKAILVTDIVIRYGAAILEGQTEDESEDGHQEQ